MECSSLSESIHSLDPYMLTPLLWMVPFQKRQRASVYKEKMSFDKSISRQVHAEGLKREDKNKPKNSMLMLFQCFLEVVTVVLMAVNVFPHGVL